MPLSSANKSFIYDGAVGSKAQREKLRSHVWQPEGSVTTDLDNALNCNQTHVLLILTPVHLLCICVCLSADMMLHLLTLFSTFSQSSQREREDLWG